MVAPIMIRYNITRKRTEYIRTTVLYRVVDVSVVTLLTGGTVRVYHARKQQRTTSPNASSAK